MALFKFRKGGDDAPAATKQAESVEVLRRRARHRLIGAAVLVLLGVIGFPLLFDTQPRPIAVDIPIEIPDRHKAKPLPAPAPSAQSPAKVADAALPKPAPATPAASAAPASATPAEPRVEARAEARVEGKAEARPSPAPPAKAMPAPAQARSDAPARPAPDGSRAQALLEGKAVQAKAPDVEGRFVVQVGAFSDVAKARETRLKVERAGLKTYTHVADTKDGRRIRVRVGPYATRAEADKAAGRIKELDLPAAVLTL
ncbi:MAG TPA: SPOR domain-containing protein [Ramlibacter sp.]|jgi:DedD protein|uniref:SPOR domain-containing protein n=1 Tax=Ramlibacter sp. TaxID=1917967 RepID=UPI002D2B01E2|nr:SPOR domain-containing protein [Ramlibacter sp.]HZY19100.1 SPOR domain-containing protein [Ramlibacter sp.]